MKCKQLEMLICEVLLEGSFIWKWGKGMSFGHFLPSTTNCFKMHTDYFRISVNLSDSCLFVNEVEFALKVSKTSTICYIQIIIT